MSDQSMVPVTQADRDAAAIVTNCTHWFTPRDRESIIHGHSDSHPLVQAFARHRIAEREACAMVADAAEESCDRATEAADTTELKDKRSFGADVASDIAAAIRARSDRADDISYAGVGP